MGHWIKFETLLLFFLSFPLSDAFSQNAKSEFEKNLEEAHSLRKEFPDSAYRMAETVLKKAREQSLRKYEGKAMIVMARALVSKGEQKKAVTLLDDAEKVLDARNDKREIAMCHNLRGLILEFSGNTSEALKYYILAYELYRGINDEAGLQEASNNMGVIYEALDDTVNSLKYHNESLELSRKLRDTSAEAGCIQNIAALYADAGYFDKAMGLYEQALEMKKAVEDWSGMARIINNQGYIFYKNGQTEKGLKYFKKALYLRKEHHLTDELASSNFNIAYVLEESGKFAEAEPYYQSAREIGLKYGKLKVAVDALAGLINIYDRLGKPHKAVKVFYDYIGMKDSLYDLEKNKQTLEIKEKYESDKKEKEIALQNERLAKIHAEAEKREEESKRKTTMLVSAMMALGLVVVLLFIVFKNYRLKQKSNLELEEKNKLIADQKNVVEMKQKEILDSIQYARRIQMTLLPDERKIENILKKYFS